MAGRKVVMQDAVSLAANAQNLNVFNSNAYVRAPFDGFITILATGSAVGLEMQLLVSGQLVIERMALNINNRVPIVPDDMLISDVPVYEGQLIQVGIFNTTAGALVPRTRVEIEEGARVYG